VTGLSLTLGGSRMRAMSDATHNDDAPAHEPDDAEHGHGGDAEHGEHAKALGPVDWFAWGAGILGVGAGLVVAGCLYLSTSL
jgi:hypothetical protein